MATLRRVDTASTPSDEPVGGTSTRVNLATRLDPRHNSLNALRLVLASLVMVSHGPEVVLGEAPFAWGDLDIGGWAVAGFFAISGWLITGSRLNLDFAPFMWRRCLRIFPAFWAALVVTAFVFAPLSWSTEPSSILASIKYVVLNVGLWVLQPLIPGTLAGNPVATWNLSLWTLFWEMLCYIGIGVLLGFKFARNRPQVVLVLLVLATLANTIIRVTEIVPPSSAPGVASRLGSFFLAGAVLKMYSHRIPASPLLLAASAAVLGLLWPLHLVGSLGGVPMAYLCIYLGAVLPLARFGRKNDISYGIYVYGFPVGQLLVHFLGPDVPLAIHITLNILLVIPLAWASWLAVERPAIALKGLVPART